MANKNLTTAKKEKNDEFYTQITDVEKELVHYREHFRNKVIFCNCDDPTWSSFWKYFHLNFEFLGLKKLISTHFDRTESTYKMEYFGGDDTNIEAGIKTNLLQNGDFRSDECIELLKESDIVVTNPPFSLFREYMAQLDKYNKKFIIIGNQNVITYKEIFPLIKDNKIWLGYHSGHTWFGVPKDYKIPENYLNEDRKKMRSNGYKIDENGTIWRNLGNICWFTNLDIPKRHEEIDLIEHYSPEKYPKYDNYDAINVNKVFDIPVDYNGVMGVPITFLDKYNPDQFEIVSFRKGEDGKDLVFTRERESSTILSYPCTTSIPGMIKNSEGKINGKPTYTKITIMRK